MFVFMLSHVCALVVIWNMAALIVVLVIIIIINQQPEHYTVQNNYNLKNLMHALIMYIKNVAVFRLKENKIRSLHIPLQPYTPQNNNFHCL